MVHGVRIGYTTHQIWYLFVESSFKHSGSWWPINIHKPANLSPTGRTFNAPRGTDPPKLERCPPPPIRHRAPPLSTDPGVQTHDQLLCWWSVMVSGLFDRGFSWPPNTLPSCEGPRCCFLQKYRSCLVCCLVWNKPNLAVSSQWWYPQTSSSMSHF